MNRKLSLEIKALKKKAKSQGKSDFKFKVASGNNSSLNKVITTKAQADTFMKFLKAL